MNKKKTILSIILGVLIVTGVIVGIKLFTGKSIKTEKYNDVINELDSYSFNEYENLEFECDVPSISADKVYQIKIERPSVINDAEASKKKLSQMASKFFGNEIDTANIIDTVNNSVKYEHIPPNSVDGNSDKYAELFASNTFLLNDSKLLHEIRYEKEVTAKAPFVKLSDNTTKIITLNGNEVNLSELVEKAKNEIERCCADVLNTDEQIMPYDAVIMKSTIDGSEYITLRFSHIIEGIEYNEDGFAPTPDEGAVTLPSYITVEMTDDGEIATIQNYYYFSIKEKTELEKIAPLSEATDTLSNQLAPNYKYKVSNVSLKYVNLSECAQVDSELRPMWCYTLDEYSGGFGDPSNFFQTQNAYVDAQNGNVYLVDSKSRMFEIHEFK